MSRPARQAIVAIYHATFSRAPDWSAGPLPLRHGELVADAARREAYYPSRTTRLIYGSPGCPRRWYRTLDLHVDGVRILAAEAVRLRDEPGSHGLIIVHLRPDEQPTLAVLRKLAGRDPAGLNGFDPQRLVDGVRLEPGVPYTLSFVTARGRLLRRLFWHPRYISWPVIDQWLWTLASRTNHTDHPPDPHRPGFPDFEFLPLSADWRGLVLRDGTAFVGRRPDRGSGDRFYNHAVLYARTIYLDAIIIGILQHHGITELENALAMAHDPSSGPALDELERKVGRFRHELWWQHLTTHGIPNQLLAAYQDQHRLRERFEQVITEVYDFNRVTREDENRYVNNTLVLFTLLTVPAGIALALLQALGSRSPWIFGAVLTVCAGITAMLLITRTGRMVLRTVRRRFNG